MMIYRSLVVGLLAAIAMLIAEQGPALDRAGERAATHAAELAAPAAEAPASADDERTTIVHVSRSGVGRDPLAVLGLGPHDRLRAIDDDAVHGSWREAVLARWDRAPPGTYFELWVDDPEGLRRTLVLVTR